MPQEARSAELNAQRDGLPSSRRSIRPWPQSSATTRRLIKGIATTRKPATPVTHGSDRKYILGGGRCPPHRRALRWGTRASTRATCDPSSRVNPDLPLLRLLTEPSVPPCPIVGHPSRFVTIREDSLLFGAETRRISNALSRPSGVCLQRPPLTRIEEPLGESAQHHEPGRVGCSTVGVTSHPFMKCLHKTPNRAKFTHAPPYKWPTWRSRATLHIWSI